MPALRGALSVVPLLAVATLLALGEAVPAADRVLHLVDSISSRLRERLV